MAPAQRRLSAILHADMTGFVRLMEGDELDTVEGLRVARREAFAPAMEEAGGRVVDSAGDSMLAEFASAVAAVEAAIAVQRRMERINQSRPEDRRLLFRIGVHLGELIVDGEGQIFGDGINLAARIQAVAAPGGIAVSRAVRDVTELQVDCAFVDAGEHRLKNVSRPVRIYHVKAAQNPAIRTTTSIVPHATLRFHGVDLGGYAFVLEVALEKLIAARSGLVIGRDSDKCELPLVHSTVSRAHARLFFGGEHLQIEDLGSTNGTLVNGTAARRGTPLTVRVGDKVRIGEIEFALRE